MVSQDEAAIKRRRVDDSINITIFKEFKDDVDDIEKRASLCTKLNDNLTKSFSYNRVVDEDVIRGYKEVIEVNRDNINNTLSELTKKLEALNIQKEENFETRQKKVISQIKNISIIGCSLTSAYELLFRTAKESKDTFDNLEYSLRRDYDELKMKSEELKRKGNRIQEDISRISVDEQNELEQTAIYRDFTTTESEQITYENNAEARAKEEFDTCSKELEKNEIALEELQKRRAELISAKSEIQKKIDELCTDIASVQEQILEQENELKSLPNENTNEDLEENQVENVIKKQEEEIISVKQLIEHLKTELELTDSTNVDDILIQLGETYNGLTEGLNDFKSNLAELELIKEQKEKEEKLLLDELRNEEQRTTQQFSEINVSRQKMEQSRDDELLTIHTIQQDVAALRSKIEVLEKTKFAKLTIYQDNTSNKNLSHSKTITDYHTPVTAEPVKEIEIRAKPKYSSDEEDISSYVPEVDGVISFSPKTMNKKKRKETKPPQKKSRRSARLKSQPQEVQEKKIKSVSSNNSLSPIQADNLIEERFPHDLFFIPSEDINDGTNPTANVSGFDAEDDLNTTFGSMLF